MLFQVNLKSTALNLSDADAILFAEALKNLVLGDQNAFNVSSVIDAASSYKVYGTAPAKPYVWICQDVPTMPNGGKGIGARHWFKKEHPIYAGHFLYVSIGVVRYSSSTHQIVISIAENVTKSGVITNEVNYFAEYGRSNDVWTNNWTGSNHGYYSNYNQPVYPCVNPSIRPGGWTLLIGNWGFGVFAGMCTTIRTSAYSNFMGAMYLETLATKLQTDNLQAFVPDNYPMIAFVHSEGVSTPSYNSADPDATPRTISLIRTPKLDNTFQHLVANKYLNCLSTNLASTDGAYRNIIGCDADGENKAQVFPVYLNIQNAMIAKLPILKPIIGSKKYTHVGKLIQSEGHNYYGIFALDKPTGLRGNTPNVTAFINMRNDATNQDYLRMD